MKLEFPFAVPVHTHWHPSEDEYRARMSAISQILERVAFSGARHFWQIYHGQNCLKYYYVTMKLETTGRDSDSGSS
jgi:hypothetical protein